MYIYIYMCIYIFIYIYLYICVYINIYTPYFYLSPSNVPPLLCIHLARHLEPLSTRKIACTSRGQTAPR